MSVGIVKCPQQEFRESMGIESGSHPAGFLFDVRLKRMVAEGGLDPAPDL